MIKTVGIIGFGRMGKILAEIFSARFKVAILPTEAANADLVIFCVPLEHLPIALKEARPFFRNNSIVMDITSVKEKPLKLMRQILPAKASILGTHPMFGPNSLKTRVAKNIVLCPIRISDRKMREVEKILQNCGLKTFKMSPKKHDQIMARSQLLTHLFGQIISNLKIRNLPFLPESFKLMQQAFKMAAPSEEFLKSLIAENKFAKKTLQDIAREVKKYLPES